MEQTHPATRVRRKKTKKKRREDTGPMQLC
jgi:hypothetical protein